MSTFSQILCVVDPTSKEQPAFDRATWLAEKSGASLDLLVCYYNEFLSGERFFDSNALAKGRMEALGRQTEKLEVMAAPLRKRGINVATFAIWDNPLYEGVVRQAHALKSDIIFKDTHHHSVLNRSIFSNTDWNLIRASQVPLWLVKPGAVSENPKLVAAIDPCNEHDKPATLDKYIIELSQSLAKDINGDVHTFHSFDSRDVIAASASLAYGTAFASMPDLEEQLRDSHHDGLSKVSEQFDLPGDQQHLASGLVQVELPKMASELGASVVVMGAISRNKLKQLYIGASAERTLEHLPCDLLVVKPEWFQSPVDMQQSDAA